MLDVHPLPLPTPHTSCGREVDGGRYTPLHLRPRLTSADPRSRPGVFQRNFTIMTSRLPLCPPLRPAKLPRVSSVLRGAGTRWYIHGARDPKAYAAVPASRASPFPISGGWCRPILPHGAMPPATLYVWGLGPGSRNWKLSPTYWPNWKFIAVPSSSQRVRQLWSN